MAGRKGALAHEGVDSTVALHGAGGVHMGHAATLEAQFCGGFAARHFAPGSAKHIDGVARLLEVGGLGSRDIADNAKNGEQHRGRNGNALAAAGVVVFHGVFARNARHAEGQRELAQGAAGAHQLGQLVAAIGVGGADHGVAPAEVVHTGQSVGVCAHGHGIADGFVHGVGHHPVGVVIAEFGADTVRNHKARIRFQQGADNARIGGAIALYAH